MTDQADLDRRYEELKWKYGTAWRDVPRDVVALLEDTYAMLARESLDYIWDQRSPDFYVLHHTDYTVMRRYSGLFDTFRGETIINQCGNLSDAKKAAENDCDSTKSQATPWWSGIRPSDFSNAKLTAEINPKSQETQGLVTNQSPFCNYRLSTVMRRPNGDEYILIRSEYENLSDLLTYAEQCGLMPGNIRLGAIVIETIFESVET